MVDFNLQEPDQEFPAANVPFNLGVLAIGFQRQIRVSVWDDFSLTARTIRISVVLSRGVRVTRWESFGVSGAIRITRFETVLIAARTLRITKSGFELDFSRTVSITRWDDFSVAARTIRVTVTNIQFPISRTIRLNKTWPLSLSRTLRLVKRTTAADWQPSSAPPTATQRWGRNSVSVVVGGLDVSVNLTGDLSVECAENEARIASFTLRTPPGAIDAYALVGQSVAISVKSIGITGSVLDVVPIFTGIVDTPEYRMGERQMTYQCTDNLQKLFEGQKLDSILSSLTNLGLTTPLWSKFMFGDTANSWDVVSSLMTAQPYSIYLNLQGALAKTGLFAASSPTLSFTQSDILDGSLSIELASASSVVNSIEMTIAYDYGVHHHAVQPYSWAWTSISAGLTEERDKPDISAIAGAISETGWGVTKYARDQTISTRGKWVWPIRGDLQFRIWVPASGDYFGESVADFTLETFTAQNRRDSTVYTVTAKDSINRIGKVESKESFSITPDYESAKADESSEFFSTRTMSSTEKGNSVENQYIVSSKGVETTFDTSDAKPEFSLSVYGIHRISPDQQPQDTNPFDDLVASDGLNTVKVRLLGTNTEITLSTLYSNYLYRKPPGKLTSFQVTHGLRDGKYTDFTDALQIGQRLAQAKIMKSHRQNRVKIAVLGKPSLTLEDAVDVNVTLGAPGQTPVNTVHAKGKVSRFVHEISIDAGSFITRIELSLSKGDAVGQVPLQDIAVKPEDYKDEMEVDTSTASALNTWDLRQQTYNEATMWGWVYNGKNQDDVFRIRTPGFGAGATDGKENKVEKSITVEITDDLLILTS